ncbi:RPAP1 [Bugula neritina]|uniref:RPAP1 n=1 Tax=Bugula neritina TaxID=10212 RepID=A0A7J7KN72_BUGNE|nr:RPAP1 [Bugula neritina]
MMVEISKENEEKISHMSHEEIIEQQKKLAAMFDTSLLEKLKNRKKGSGISSVSFKPTTDRNNPAPLITENSEKPVATIQKDIVDPISSSDLPFKLDDKWLHMDQLEHEKLRWLKPLDEHKKNKKGIKEKLSARFDFTGEVVNPEEPVGAASGLHHHGDEPEAAGYTLEELYILVRSLNAAQKVLALATLSNVLRKAKSGHYLYLLNNSIVNSLLQADIVLLLRYALDEKSELVVAAAVNAWHSLLCQQQDTKSLELLSCSMTGHLVPELVAVDVSPPTTEEEIIEREEEQYLEVLKRDVISGLLLMDFLPRLRYILEVIRPQLVVCSQILDILCRMMTSSETSYKLSRTPRLLNVVFEEFLPMSFTPVAENDECGHGKPLVEAMRFARCLCASGRTMAVDLIARHGLMERIVRYVSSTDPSEFGVVYSKLIVESLLTWRTLVLYGLGCEHYIILRPSLITRLQVETDDSIIVALVCLLTSLLAAADATASTDKRKKTVHFSDSTTGESAEAPSPALDWTQVSGLIDSVYSMAMKSVQNFLESYSEHHSTYDLSILISLLDFVHSYLTHARLQPFHVECFVTPQAILSDTVKIFRQLLTSTAFSKLLINIRQSSILLNESGYLTSESSNSLPSLLSLPKPANIDEAEVGASTQLKPQAIHLLLSLQTLIRLLRSTLSSIQLRFNRFV